MESDNNNGHDNVTIYRSASSVIYRGPCLVKSVNVAGDGANADCQVYDGDNDKAQQKAHIEALSGTSFNWLPGSGTKFQYGIYLVVNAATTKVSVTLEPVTV